MGKKINNHIKFIVCKKINLKAMKRITNKQMQLQLDLFKKHLAL